MKQLLTLSLILISITGFSQEETASQKSMAKNMASMMDRAWEANPEEGTANARFLFKNGDVVFFETISIYGKLNCSIQGRWNYTQAFNPNENGRFVYESIEPGTYTITIEGTVNGSDFKWTKQGVVFQDGDSPLFEINVGD
ncbi:MAG: hypothetical protein Crog4KO_02770 [Crocinitomicaceae bacterium]